MKSLLESLSSVGFHVLLFVVGIVLVVFSIFDGVSSSSDSWRVVARATPLGIVLAIGVVLTAASIVLYLVGEPDSKFALLPSQRIKTDYENLSDTQKKLVAVFYNIHRENIRFDDFYEFLQRSDEEKLARMDRDEAIYRLKDLYRVRLLGMKSMGNKSTVLRILPKVSAVLKFRSGY